MKCVGTLQAYRLGGDVRASSYEVEDTGVEPATSAVQRRRSPN